MFIKFLELQQLTGNYVTIDEAVLQMHSFLKTWMADAELSDEELYILMSLGGQVGVSQIVDPLKTAKFVFPKAYIDR